MTVDDENSVYVGGLPYDSTEDTIQRAFEIYGTIIAVKIVNDREFGGKCYGFVTFTNPRAAVNAISDMDGRAIGGRTVRVNEVKSKSSRAALARDNHSRDRARDRDRDRDRDSRDRDRDRDRDRNRDRERDDRDEDREQQRERVRDRARDTDRDSDLDRDRESRFRNRIGAARHISSPRDQKPSPRNLNSTVKRSLRERARSPRGRSYSGSSSDKKRNASLSPSPKRYERLKIDENPSKQKLTSTLKEKDLEKVKEELDEAIQRRDELKHEVCRMEEESYKKQLFMSEMQKKSQKLEESISTAKRTALQRRKQLKKLHNCFLQFKGYSEKLKSCEQELQLLVDASVLELNGLDDGGNEDGHTANANGDI